MSSNFRFICVLFEPQMWSKMSLIWIQISPILGSYLRLNMSIFWTNFESKISPFYGLILTSKLVQNRRWPLGKSLFWAYFRASKISPKWSIFGFIFDPFLGPKKIPKSTISGSFSIRKMILFRAQNELENEISFRPNFGSEKQISGPKKKSHFRPENKIEFHFWSGKENEIFILDRKRKFIFGPIFFEKSSKMPHFGLKSSKNVPFWAYFAPFWPNFRHFLRNRPKSAEAFRNRPRASLLRPSAWQKLRFWALLGLGLRPKASLLMPSAGLFGPKSA